MPPVASKTPNGFAALAVCDDAKWRERRRCHRFTGCGVRITSIVDRLQSRWHIAAGRTVHCRRSDCIQSAGDPAPNLLVTHPATDALLCYLFPVITDTDSELEKAQALLARVDELTDSLKEPGLSKRAQSQRINEIHRLLDQAAKIMTTVELVFDAVDADKKSKRLN